MQIAENTKIPKVNFRFIAYLPKLKKIVTRGAAKTARGIVHGQNYTPFQVVKKL
jgi:hypothetical protein